VKILIFVKHVADTETRIKLSADGMALDSTDTKHMVNPYDEFAIEEAIQTKTKLGADELIAITMGPARCQEAIRKAMAMGADSGIWVNTDGVPDSNIDSLVTAQCLAKVAEQEQANLIFAGQKAIDDDCGHIGPMVAELLGAAHVQVVTKIELGADKASARVHREVEGGMVEVYNVKLPVVLGAHKSLNEPRFPSLPGIMKAKKKPLKEIKFTDLSPQKPTTQIVGYSLPPEKQPGKTFKGQPVEQMVKEVVQLLRSEAKVI
jgi:electron transfer flavoprotein beta subunit